MARHKPCPNCGKSMDAESKKCKACYEAERARPGHYIEKSCAKCGKIFTVHKIHIERGQGNYCSRECARSGSPTRKKKTPVVSCHSCGKSFEKYKSEMSKNVSNLNFCSRECWVAYNQRENHVGWEGGQHERLGPAQRAWRKAVIARDKGYCRRCHSTERLEAHHIKRFSTHPELRLDISNGVSLCHSCHTLFRNKEEQYAEMLGFIASVPLEVWNV